MRVGSVDELKEVLTVFGIPNGLVFDYSGGFALYNHVGQGLATKTPEGWAFTTFPEGYLDGVRKKVLESEQEEGVDAYVSRVVDGYRGSIEASRRRNLELFSRAAHSSKPASSVLPKADEKETPLIIGELDLRETKGIIPNSRHEGGIERAFEQVSDKKGGLIGIVGGFDFLATLTTNGQFSQVVGFDINPYQVMVGAIRAALCEISATPFHYLSNLLSLDFEEEEDLADFRDLHIFFEETCYETPSRVKMEETWSALEPILRKETRIDIQKWREVWYQMSDLYRQQNVQKRSIVTEKDVNIYLRELQEVNLRKSGNSVSWLATQKNYDRVRSLISSGNFVFMVGDLFENGVERAESHLKDKGVQGSVLYISNVPSYVSPSGEQLARLEGITTRLRESGVFVTDGSAGRG